MKLRISPSLALLLLVLFSAPSTAQTFGTGIAAGSGVLLVAGESNISFVVGYQLWRFGPVNEVANNVPVEGGWKAHAVYNVKLSTRGRWQPFLGVEYRQKLERIGNKSVLFRDYFEKIEGPTVVYPTKKAPTTGSFGEDQNIFMHPGFSYLTNLRGQYNQLGMIAGVTIRLTHHLSISGYAGYLPVIASNTIRQQRGGLYHYADRGNPWVADIALTINMLGERNATLTGQGVR